MDTELNIRTNDIQTSIWSAFKLQRVKDGGHQTGQASP